MEASPSVCRPAVKEDRRGRTAVTPSSPSEQPERERERREGKRGVLSGAEEEAATAADTALGPRLGFSDTLRSDREEGDEGVAAAVAVLTHTERYTHAHAHVYTHTQTHMRLPCMRLHSSFGVNPVPTHLESQCHFK